MREIQNTALLTLLLFMIALPVYAEDKDENRYICSDPEVSALLSQRELKKASFLLWDRYDLVTQNEQKIYLRFSDALLEYRHALKLSRDKTEFAEKKAQEKPDYSRMSGQMSFLLSSPMPDSQKFSEWAEEKARDQKALEQSESGGRELNHDDIDQDAALKGFRDDAFSEPGKAMVSRVQESSNQRVESLETVACDYLSDSEAMRAVTKPGRKSNVWATDFCILSLRVNHPYLGSNTHQYMTEEGRNKRWFPTSRKEMEHDFRTTDFTNKDLYFAFDAKNLLVPNKPIKPWLDQLNARDIEVQSIFHIGLTSTLEYIDRTKMLTQDSKQILKAYAKMKSLEEELSFYKAYYDYIKQNIERMDQACSFAYRRKVWSNAIDAMQASKTALGTRDEGFNAINDAYSKAGSRPVAAPESVLTTLDADHELIDTRKVW